MKRLLIVLYIVLLPTAFVEAQTLVTIKIYSKYVKDSVPVKIWLPKDYSNTEQYPAIYEFIYDHSNYIAATASSIWDLPKVIVVWAQIEGGSDYKSPNLSDIGNKYYAFIKNELINYVSEAYHTTHFRIAAGLSQGADYINYILRNDPSLFSSYLVFSIEYPIYYTPNFSSYTARIKDSLSYFIAIANDEEERMKFAKQLADSLQASLYIKIKKESYPNASHGYSILYALPDALLFTFEDYNTIRPKLPSESLVAYYTSRLKEKTETFGNINYHSFVLQAFQSADVEKESVGEINSVLDLVYVAKEVMDIDFLNVGYFLRSKKLYQNAEKAYRMALLKKQESGKTAIDDLSVYFQLFKVYDLEGNTAQATEILQEGYQKTKDRDEGLLYRLGDYYIDKKININKGIELLKSMLNDKHTVSSFWTEPKDAVYSKIATGYWALKNKKQAKLFLDKALEVNPKNEAALKLQASIK